MHSTGKTSAFFTIIERPRSQSAWGANRSGRPLTSSVMKWLATMSPSTSNQKIDSFVRTSPLKGIGSGSTTSNALMRSVATRSRRSPRS